MNGGKKEICEAVFRWLQVPYRTLLQIETKGEWISRIEGGRETLHAIGVPLVFIKDNVHNIADIVGSAIFKEKYNSLVQFYNELPQGTKVAISFAEDVLTFKALGSIASITISGANKSKMLLKEAPTIELVEVGESASGIDSKLNLLKNETRLPAEFHGEVTSFSTREEARMFGHNEVIQKEANNWFKKATNTMMEGTNIPKYEKFKVIEMQNGNIVMEYSAKSDTVGYNKRFIKVLDKYGNELKSFRETIQPDGIVKETKEL